MYLVFLLYALFASVFTISKTALEYTQPFFLIGTRMVAAGLLMLGYEYFRNRDVIKIKSSVWMQLGILGVINIYLTNLRSKIQP
jgi:drug/metabolite transporter (DMT)-like permease